MRIGFTLSCEEYPPEQLLTQARRAAAAGFEGFSISDHFHPWLDDQGESAFVWSMIGALSQISDLPVTTAVTCPTMRIQPAIVAQAAATCGVLTNGRFILGVGSGEALNESITGQVWPPASVRLEMLEEAIELIRELWTGKTVTHRGKHFTVHRARIYTRPDQPPPIYISAFGPKAMQVAGRLGDGLITTRPDPGSVKRFHELAGADKPVQGGMKACFSRDMDEAVKMAHQKWPTSGLPGEISSQLPTPEHFEQVSQLVTPEMTSKEILCGADARQHLEQIDGYRRAGVDELYVTPVGRHDLEMIDFYASEILPAMKS